MTDVYEVTITAPIWIYTTGTLCLVMFVALIYRWRK